MSVIFDSIHLDHDRKDVPGTPELARTIFGKVKDAAVFVADATIVAPRQRASDEGEEGSGLINSNVAIEYGYAVSALCDNFILLCSATIWIPILIVAGHCSSRTPFTVATRVFHSTSSIKLAPFNIIWRRMRRKHRGWTLAGWVGALCWAVSGTARRETPAMPSLR